MKAVYEKTNVIGADIYISRLDTAGKGDSIVLYNPNSEAVTLSGYYLSDKSSQLDRWTIPTVTINAESELIIVCKNNKEESALQKLVTNFNMKTGETVYLSDPDGNVISKAEVVEMKEGEVLVRREDGGYEIRSAE
ncbi:MAG: lamin tail domain-containing protein [Ruminiclostridium sp.]|nr:lamin tail domain-containing protein [Ruminiclostridium sp.]